MIEKLVDAGICETGELDFRDGSETLCRQPNGYAGDSRFGQGSIEHPILAIKLQKALSRAEHTAIDSNIFSKDHDARVVRHGASKRQVDRLHEAEFGHAGLV
jgi:hypothetical protein